MLKILCKSAKVSHQNAKVAQLVEHVPEEDVVAGSSPALGTK